MLVDLRRQPGPLRPQEVEEQLQHPLQVKYSRAKVKNQPISIARDSLDPGKCCTLVMTDSDAMGLFSGVNTRGNDMSSGTVLFHYMGSGPPKADGPLKCDKAILSKQYGDHCSKFKVASPHKKYELKSLAACTCYQVEWDSCVTNSVSSCLGSGRTPGDRDRQCPACSQAQ
ncbi:unnamed protein product [Nyctereutes procyonoides]|uniref:(raccoon dog) hypothetical protein n=1 Tax=Nyctereutes procyonoides TaxID=34880 RepID=A0A811ZYP5_NYCPR|nr:unnamed protein product [Nyctereutes procyonoides]